MCTKSSTQRSLLKRAGELKGVMVRATTFSAINLWDVQV
ncbi:hypothetical protein HHE02_13290 [Helicobacter heilmannii]|nr:hypothetical protein HHE02_13290 [Helicobacter heilmannii]